jgi:hypothetical protein
MGPPDTKLYEFPGPDESWRKEMIEFEEDIAKAESGKAEKRKPSDRKSGVGLAEARAAMVVVEEIYRKAESGTKQT